MWNKQSKWLHTGGRGWNPGWAQTALILLNLRLEGKRGGSQTVIHHACLKTTLSSSHQGQTAPPDQAGRPFRVMTVATQWRKLTLALSGTGRGASAAALVALFMWSTSSGLSSHNSLTSTWITTTPREQPGKTESISQDQRVSCPSGKKHHHHHQFVVEVYHLRSKGA